MQQLLVIQHVRIFDGSRIVPQNTVVIENGFITAVGENLPPPQGAQVIDGSGQTLLPGLIDAHTHVWNAQSLKQALMFGVTTELDMFMSHRTMRRLKKRLAKNRGWDMADLRSAGTLATAPGGHGTEYRLRIPTLQTAAQAQAFVDSRIREGSDYIKIIYDDGRATGFKQPTLSKEVMGALVAAAHRRGKLAIVHTVSLQESRDAIEAGVDGLAHVFADEMPDPEFGRFVAAHHAFVIPTLTVIESICGLPTGAPLVKDDRLAPYLPVSTISNLQRGFSFGREYPHHFAAAQEAIVQLKAAGVSLLVGTDASNPGTAHGVSIHRELELLVQAGMTAGEALAAATSVNAAIFGLHDRGRIAPGLRADLLLVRGDPTSDIQATRDIAGVWKCGYPVERQAYRASLEKRRLKLRSRAAPAGSQAGLISDFEEGKPGARFGSRWRASTDRWARGHSKASCRVVSEGANGEKKSLFITGEVSPAISYAWAGATYYPGKFFWRTANLSNKKGISFWAKGDGQTYRAMISAGSFQAMPATVTFVAGPNWQQYAFTFEQFGLSKVECLEVRFVSFAAGPKSGPFAFSIDHIALFS